MPLDVTKIKYHMDLPQFQQILKEIYENYTTGDWESEDLRKEYLLGDLFQFTYLQGVYLAADTREPGTDAVDVVYSAIINGRDSWDMALAFYKENMHLEINPAFYMLGVRELFNGDSKADYDVALSKAFDRVINEAMDTLKKAIEVHEEVKPEDVPDDIDEEAFVRFFEAFKDIKSFRRDRNAYDTDEQKVLHDELMSIYYSILKSGGSING